MAGTALALAVSVSSPANAVTQVVNGSDIVIVADPADFPAIQFLTDNTATVGPSVNITDTVTTSVNGQGTLVISGGSTINGVVGSSGFELKAIDAGLESVVFTNNVHANDINVTGSNILGFGGNVVGDIHLNNYDATIQMTGGGNITGDITSVAGGGNGTLTLGSSSNVTGSVASIGNSLKILNVGVSGTSVINGAVYADELNVTGSGKTTLSSTFTGLDINIASSGELVLDGAVTLVNAINFTSNNSGILTIGSGLDLLNDVDNIGFADRGIVNLVGGAQNITGDLGSTFFLASIYTGADGATTTFDGEVSAQEIKVTGTGTSIFNNTVSGNIDFSDNDGVIVLSNNIGLAGSVDNTGVVSNLGTLTLSGGGQSITGPVGTTRAIGVINGGANASVSDFSSTVNAQTINVTGTGEIVFRGDVTGDVSFGADGVITLENGANTLTGDIDTGVLNTGTLNLIMGFQEIVGNIGATNALKEINVASTNLSVATLSGTVDAQNINLKGIGSLTINGDVTSDINFEALGGVLTFGDNADLTGVITTTNTFGDITLLGSSTFSGDVGAVADLVSSITAGADGSNSTFSSNVYADDVSIVGSGVVNFANDLIGTNLTYLDDGTVNITNSAATITLANGVDFNDQNGVLALASGVSFVGAIDNTGADPNGTLTLLGGVQTVSEDIGITNSLATINAGVNGSTSTFSKTVNASNINLSNTGIVNFDDDVTGDIDFAGGSATVNFANNADYTGNMTTASNSTGILVFAGSSSVTGNIGANLMGVESIDVGSAISNSTFTGDVYATDINITGDGVVNFDGSISGDQLTYADAGTVNLINPAATVTLTTGVDFNDQDGILNLVDSINLASPIDNTAGAGGKGTVNLLGGTQTISGDVGATNSIATINGAADGADSTFSGNVAATNINLIGTGNLGFSGGDIDSAIDFNVTGGTLTFGDGANLTSGAITTSSNNTGSLVLTGSSTFSGDVGTNLRSIISLSGGAVASTSTFSNDVYATNVGVTGTGVINFANDLITTGLTYGGAGIVNITNNAATITITNGVNFNGENGTFSLASGASFAYSVDNTGTAGNGILTLLGGVQTISEAVGTTNNIGTVNAGANAAVSNFSDTVATNDINVTGTGTINFADDVIGTIDFNVAGGIVNLADLVDVTGGFTTAVDNNGTLNIAGNSIISGGVGAFTRDLSVINTGVSGTSSTISGDVYANTVNILGTGTLTLGGNVTGAIDGTGVGIGSGVGNVILTSSGTGITAIGAGGVLDLLRLSGTGNTVAVAGNVSADTIDLELNTLIINAGGGLVVAAGQTLDFDIGTASSGLIIATNGAAVDANTTVNLNVSITEYVPDGATYTIIDDLTDSGGIADIANISANDTAMVSYIQDTTNDDDLVITVSRKLLTTFTNAPNTAVVANLMDTVGMSGDADMDQVQIALQTAGNAGDNQGVIDILDSLSTPADGGYISSSLNLGALTQGIYDGRLASLRLGDASYYIDGETGINAGVMVHGYGTWVQAYGSSGKQNSFGDYNGYNLNTHGFVFGIDTSEIFEDTVVGISFSTGQSSSTTTDVNQTNIDVRNYGFTLYSNYDFNNNIFLDTQIGYGYNTVEGERQNVGDPADPKIATSSYSSSQYLGRAVFGADIWTDKGIIITPTMSITPTYLFVGSYGEKGAGGLNLSVESTDLFVLDAGIGVNIATKLRSMEDSTMLKPMIHAKYTHDVIGDNYLISSTLTGDPSNNLFQIADSPRAKDRINTGVGVSYSSDLYALSVKYDYEIRDHYQAHSGSIRLLSGF